MGHYFPLAFAKSGEERMQFNFELHFLDKLKLPCPIGADDGPELTFGTRAEAVGYLRQEVKDWVSAQAETTPDETTEAALRKEDLFGSEGEALAPVLTTGVAELDANVDSVRLDRLVLKSY